MGSVSLNPLILADKLSKLNSSQQSIESLSHWCIFHMNKAKQVVETWARQFHCAPREQRLAFLYLANDILQNSRRKGAEFVAEFWKVLPDALHDVIENGDEFGKKSVLRLINIWDERKVFGSRGQMLKEEFVKRQLDNKNNNNNSRLAGYKLRSPGGNGDSFGNILDKLVSGYQAVYGSQFDEDAVFDKCKNAISVIDKVDKDMGSDYGLGPANSGITEELKGQNAILRDCIEQLAVIESSRANLVSLLREALQDQACKLEEVRDQLQAAQTHSEQADTLFRQLHNVNDNGHVHGELNGNPIPTPLNFIPISNEQLSSVGYTQQVQSFPKKPEDPKSTAAAVAAQLAASSSSAQMLTYVLSSLASEGIIGNNNNNYNNNNNNNNNPIEDQSDEYPSEKRAKIENDEKPQPPSSPPPEPPLPPPVQLYPLPQYMQTAMPMSYGYNVGSQMPIAQSGYVPLEPPMVVPPANAYQGYTPESGFCGQPSSLPMAPMSRQ